MQNRGMHKGRGQVAQMASVKTSPGQHKNREIKQLRLIIIIITQKATEVRFYIHVQC